MQPSVSVIIPAHNAASFITEAVNSALAQSYPHKEVVVVDDGSTDGTWQVLAGFDGRIRALRQDNAGPAVARNRGVQAASGDLLAFLDADDLWLPDKLRQQVRCLAEYPDCRLVFHNWHVVQFGSGEEAALLEQVRAADAAPLPDYRPRPLGWLYNELLLDSVFCTDAVMMRRVLFEEAGGFDESLPQGQDYDLWLRLSRLTPVVKLDAPLAVVRIRSGSISTTPRAVNYRARIVQRTLERWGRVGPDGRVTGAAAVRAVLAQNWFEFGYGHLCRGDGRVAVDAFRRAIALRPTRAKAWINLLRAALKTLRGPSAVQ